MFILNRVNNDSTNKGYKFTMKCPTKSTSDSIV